MRQAGRYLPEYRELRKGRTMLEAVSTPEVSIEATLQPIRRFGFDAAILFSDLTVPFTPMGAPFEIKEGVGPVVHDPVRTAADMERIHRFDPREGLPFVLETIRGLKRELAVPLIGFTGAPFTLASYLIEGGPSRDLRRTKGMMWSAPEQWHALMELLSDVVAEYLVAQIEAGADAVQLFDSWVGSLSPEAYREYLLPHMQRIFARLKETGAPVIHFGTGNPLLLPIMREAGGDVTGVDFRITLEQAATLVPGAPLQGNLDPTVLQTNPETVERIAREIVRQGSALPGHIFNLGHGILPETPLENVERLVEVVKGERP
ncbi:uroporphyrinogen decarboxylase [Fimbriimonas ginsengisoli Gsoil 348]|uniref:Uroporphyrinogen decarboxylase n=2 Tax=Fimbriimonas ginsengisoli TaxID=1005039 RepID=A0A068NRR5_FIMGI|nr:uroporphyrinogen decarboxylase [Fimbriimonas ginsengisoli Gsoil 348]